MIERAIENWLTKTNERNYQTAFCQVLMHQGHRVLHSSSHGPMEQGKDIITISPDGEPCAYQTKTGDIGLSEWRAIQGEIQELIELPVNYPGVDKAKLHKAYLVTNGVVSDPVRIQINDRNEDNARKGRQYAHLTIVAKDALLKDFIDAQGKFVPRELPEIRSFLEIYLDEGVGPLPKEKLFDALEKTVFRQDDSSPAAFRDAVTSSLVIVTYLLNAFERAGNHYALAEGWTVLAANIARYAIRHSVPDKQWKDSLALVLGQVRAKLTALRDETFTRENLLEGDVRADGGMILRARATIVLGSLACHYLTGATAPNDSSATRLRQFIKDNLKHLWYWGDSAFPYYFHIIRYLEAVGDSAFAAHVLRELFAEITEANFLRQETIFASPYYTAEQVLAAGVHDRLDDTDFSGCIGSSYVIRTLSEMLARRSERDFLGALWRKFTYVQQHEFIPNRCEDLFTWKTKEGVNDSRFPEQTQSWPNLRVAAADRSATPDVYKRFIDILPFHIMVCPHRASPAVIRLLDTNASRGSRTRIAILAWGSLVWRPRDLTYIPPWTLGGPVLPIEFSRISSDGRLTLVIDSEAGSSVSTRFAESAKETLEDAMTDLQAREGITNAERIGYVDLVTGKERSRVASVTEVIRQWAWAQQFDAVIWTDLPPNFMDKKGVPFSIESAVSHVDGLTSGAKASALDYIRLAPEEVDTPVRRRFAEAT